MEVSGGSCPVFKENELVGGAGVCVGVVVHDGARPGVLNNVFKECGKAGIHISDAASPLVRRNKMFACAEHGIFITGSVSDACVVEENEMMGCQLAGIEMMGCQLAGIDVSRGRAAHSGKEGGGARQRHGRTCS